MKKIGTFFMALIIMVCTIHLPVDASEIVCSDTIPDKMQPETIISFISDDKYIIEKGGISQEKHEIVLPEEIADKIQTAKNDGSYYTAYHAELPDPVEGLKVYYADDGYILRFVYPEGVENPLMKEVKSPNENIVRKETREGPGPNDTLLYTWGAHNNQIWKIAYSSTARLGFGRATNFTDRIGQRDNVLKKGDAATSLAYDNCAYGTELDVLTYDPDGDLVTHVLYKRDVGGMPDAVLDIWKTGVEYFGYTWSSSLSINNVQYVHE